MDAGESDKQSLSRNWVASCYAFACWFFFSFWVNVFTTIPLHFKWKPKGLLLSLLVLLSPFFYVRPFAVILCTTMPLIVRGPLDANGLCRCARRTNDEDNERNRFTLSSLPHHIYSICIPVSQPRYCLNVLYSEPNVIRSCKKNSTLDMHCTVYTLNHFTVSSLACIPNQFASYDCP